MTRSPLPCPAIPEAPLHRVLLATDDEAVRHDVLAELARHGLAARTVASWGECLAQLADRRVALLLVDGALPGADGTLLAGLAAALPHRPRIVAVRGEIAGVEPIGAGLERIVAQASSPVLDPDERALLELCGLGEAPLVALQELAAGRVPLRIEAERGLGKEWLARLVHRLDDPDRPFVVVGPDDADTLRGHAPGTLFLEHLDRHPRERIIGALQLADATGWRVIAGSREAPDPEREGRTWRHLRIEPLRGRPRDLRPLTKHYVRVWRKRLGLPARRLSARLLERLESYPWPGNHRELEAFVVQAITSARGATLSPDTLPRRVLALLDRESYDPREADSFEQVVEERLRPIVARFEPGAAGPSLQRLVLDATERALYRLVLARTGGNVKAAAELLGIARNTLRSRLARLEEG